MNYKNKQKGFTLIEVLIVLAIVGLMSSIVVTSTITVREKAKVSKTATTLDALAKAAELAHDQAGVLPCTFSYPVMGTWDDTQEVLQFQNVVNWPRSNLWGGVFLWSGASIAGQPYAIMSNNVPFESALALDAYIDDGSLTTGRLRSLTTGPIINIAFGLPAGMSSISGGCPARLGHVLPP